MPIEAPIPLLETIMATWQATIGNDYQGYKNHVYRMVHFCFALHECTDEERDKVIIAACFHDLGIWAHDTVDYLPPSISLAGEYLRQNHQEQWVDEITLMIDMHHKFKPYTDARYPLVDVFRKADWVDFSLGWLRAGLPKAYVNHVKNQFPNAGFHKRLLQLAWGWFSKHPISAPPFMKW